MRGNLITHFGYESKLFFLLFPHRSFLLANQMERHEEILTEIKAAAIDR